jgi:two-component system response regulator HydG
MRADKLRLEDLLETDPEGGVFRFAGQRTLLVDALAFGLLRAQLVKTLSMHGARALLTQLGYAHGWRSAQAIRHTVNWQSEREWRIAGGRLHRLQGMVSFEPVRSSESLEPAFARAIWKDSYEAEQHLVHLGLHHEPVCWSLCGFASGYLSAATGEEIYCIEESCVGAGDAVCRMVGRTRTDWGETIESHLPYYERDCLQEALERTRRDLRQLEAKLRSKRQLLAASERQVEQDGMIVRSAEMESVVAVATRAAHVDTTVLILGETGVGKERLARLIHKRSPRAAAPFIAINCGAIPETLLEGELFGYAKGAFTGAIQHRPGLFEAAHGGTLFLDEIAELSPQLQVRLLRVLQQRTVRRLGENKDREIDVRLLSATHRDLRAGVAAGSFREDLLYRLRVVEIVIPPLRDRRDDILPLARMHLASTSKRFARKVSEMSSDVARRLVEYDWPGNVRELFNAVERAVVFADESCLQLEDLPSELRELEKQTPERPEHSLAIPLPTGVTLAEMERTFILQTLEQTGGNKAAAARQLDIGVATLFRKLKRYAQSDS